MQVRSYPSIRVFGPGAPPHGAVGFVWRLAGFAALGGGAVSSPPFEAFGGEWSLWVYPHGLEREGKRLVLAAGNGLVERRISRRLLCSCYSCSEGLPLRSSQSLFCCNTTRSPPMQITVVMSLWLTDT